MSDPFPSMPRTVALSRGELIDCSRLARSIGFTCPVAITRAVSDECVAAAGDMGEAAVRIHDLLFVAMLAAARPGVERVTFPHTHKDPVAENVTRISTLVLEIGAGDFEEQAVTIMLASET